VDFFKNNLNIILTTSYFLYVYIVQVPKNHYILSTTYNFVCSANRQSLVNERGSTTILKTLKYFIITEKIPDKRVEIISTRNTIVYKRGKHSYSKICLGTSIRNRPVRTQRHIILNIIIIYILVLDRL